MKKKTNNIKVFMSIFIIVVMVGSVLGIFIGGGQGGLDQGETTTHDYNGHEFILTAQGWYLQYGENYIPVANLPDDLADIAWEPLFLNEEHVYLAYYPADYDQNLEFSLQKLQGLFQGLNRRASPSCFEEEGCGDLPIVSCQDENRRIVGFVIGEENRVYVEDNCIILSAINSTEFSREADVVMYEVLGVL